MSNISGEIISNDEMKRRTKEMENSGKYIKHNTHRKTSRLANPSMLKLYDSHFEVTKELLEREIGIMKEENEHNNYLLGLSPVQREGRISEEEVKKLQPQIDKNTTCINKLEEFKKEYYDDGEFWKDVIWQDSDQIYKTPEVRREEMNKKLNDIMERNSCDVDEPAQEEAQAPTKNQTLPKKGWFRSGGSMKKRIRRKSKKAVNKKKRKSRKN